MAKKIDYVAVAKERYAAALENQRPKFTKFNDFDYIFRSRLKKYDPNIPSKVFNPIVWAFIETIQTRLLAKPPTIAYKPREEMDEEQAELQSELFNYWFDRSGAFQTLADLIKQALIYGTGVIKVDWLTSPQRVVKGYQTDPITGEAIIDPATGQFVTEEQVVTDYDDPRIQNINIYDFFVDPNATTIDDAKWVIHQYYTSLSELEAMNASLPEPLYDPKGLKKLRDLEEGITDPESENYEQERRSAAGYTANTHSRGKGQVKIWEMWSRTPEGIKVCIIANESVDLREGPSPYWHGYFPFIRYVDSPNTLDFYGTGEIEPVEKMVHALNTLINQRITNISQILNPVWIASSRVEDTELQFIPNSIIHANDIKNDVDILKQQDVTASSFQEQAVITETIQRALGVTDYVQGVQTPGQTKAEVEIKTAQANTRFNHKVMIFEQMVLKRLGEIIHALYQQFITTEKIIRVAGQDGEKFVRLTPADLVGFYDVIPESGSTLEVDQEADARKFMNLYAIMQGKPYINQFEMDKEAFEQFGQKDPERFFLSEEELNEQLINAAGALPGIGPEGPGATPLEAPAGPGLV